VTWFLNTFLGLEKNFPILFSDFFLSNRLFGGRGEKEGEGLKEEIDTLSNFWLDWNCRMSRYVKVVN
jgi:hypothetical protein